LTVITTRIKGRLFCTSEREYSRDQDLTRYSAVTDLHAVTVLDGLTINLPVANVL